MSRYSFTIEDDGDAGFRGYLGGDRWQTNAEHERAEQQAGDQAIRAMFQFMPADWDCPPNCWKCKRKRRP